MKKTLQKIKRMKPLVRAKKQELDHEAIFLKRIREEQEKTQKALLEHQQSYVSGVDSINKDRSSGNIESAIVLESAVDVAKFKWHTALRRLSALNDKERQQLDVVMRVQQNLKSFENLQESYEEQLKVLVNKAELKESDELATIKSFKEHS